MSWKTDFAGRLSISEIEDYVNSFELSDEKKVECYGEAAMINNKNEVKNYLISLIPLCRVGENINPNNFHIAALTGSKEHFELGLKSGRNITDGFSRYARTNSFTLAADHNNLDILKLFLENGYECDPTDEPWKCSAKTIEIADLLLNHTKVVLKKKISANQLAAICDSAGSFEVVSHLLKTLPAKSIQLKKNDFNTYHLAAITGNVELLAIAKEDGSQIDQATKNFKSLLNAKTPLDFALQCKNFEMFVRIREELENKEIRESMISAAIRMDELEVFEFLKSEGASFESLNKGNYFITPKSIDGIRFLVENGMDLKRENKDGLTIVKDFFRHSPKGNSIEFYDFLKENGLPISNSAGVPNLLYLMEQPVQFRNDMPEFVQLFKHILTSEKIELDKEIQGIEEEWSDEADDYVVLKTTIRSEVANLLSKDYPQLVGFVNEIESVGTPKVKLNPFNNDFSDQYKKLKERGHELDINEGFLFDLVAGCGSEPGSEIITEILEKAKDKFDLTSLKGPAKFDLFGYYVFNMLSSFAHTNGNEKTIITSPTEWFLGNGFSLETLYSDKQTREFNSQLFGYLFESNTKGKTLYEILKSSDIYRFNVPQEKDSQKKGGLLDYLEFLEKLAPGAEELNKSAEIKKFVTSNYGFNSNTFAFLGYGEVFSPNFEMSQQQIEEIAVLINEVDKTSQLRIQYVAAGDMSNPDYDPLYFRFFLGIEMCVASTECPSKVDLEKLDDCLERFNEIPDEIYKGIERILGDDQLSEVGLHFLTCGPLASGFMVKGNQREGGHGEEGFYIGNQSDQDPQLTGVEGELIARVDMWESPTLVEVSDGDYWLIASYD